LQFSVHLSVSATSPTIVQGGQLQKERCCKHLGRPGPAKKKQTQNLCLQPACTAL
jgi:hypothetical protein